MPDSDDVASREGGTLVLIPGLGSDSGLYEPQRRYFGERLYVPPWLQPAHEEETLEQYAHRLAEVIRSAPQVRPPFYVGGISFGGMLAAEIAECCAADVGGLLLIGACLDRLQVTPIFHLTAVLGQYIPNGLAKGALNKLAPSMIAGYQGLGPEAADVFTQCATRTDTHLLKWGARAIHHWQTLAHPRCPVYHAHGRRDTVIPIRMKGPLRPGIDLVVPDGTHLIHMTHAPVVNRWIEGIIGGNHKLNRPSSNK